MPPEPTPNGQGKGIEAAYGRRARLSLLDFLDVARLAADLVGRGKQAYESDVQLRLAGEAIVHKLGQSAARLPTSIIADHPQIPFRAMKAMRNLVAQECDRSDPEIIWVTFEQHLPAVAAQVAALMAPATGQPPLGDPAGSRPRGRARRQEEQGRARRKDRGRTGAPDGRPET